jgi:carbonic anhydrase
MDAAPERLSAAAGDEPTPAGAATSVGQRQSPIALVSSEAVGSCAMELQERFAYKPSVLSLVSDGQTVEAGYDAGSAIWEGGAAYSLAQFHFHSPSEHTLDGERFPLEIHLVHKDETGKAALVIGAFVREGPHDPLFDGVLAGLPTLVGKTGGATIDATALVPADRTHFAYDGSLTTPPWTEGIRWRVILQPIEMSATQMEAFRSLRHLGHRNRPLQPANGRTVLLVSKPPKAGS